MTESALTRALGYIKFPKGNPTRMMVMKTDYFTNEDIIITARAMGWEVFELATPKEGVTESSYLTEMLQSLVEFKPDFILTINHMGFDIKGILSGILSNFKIPLASWFIDHPLPILAGSVQNTSDFTQIFCFEKTALPWLKKIGFIDPEYLPTSSSSKIFKPDLVDSRKAKHFGRPLALVASSWWKKAHDSFSEETRDIARKMSEENRMDSNLIIRLQDDTSYFQETTIDQTHVNAIQVALAASSMHKRANFVSSLSELSPTVYGDIHWNNLVEHIDLRPVVHPTKELPSVFAGSTINLNITAEHMPTAVNQRVWDVPAVGGFLLTDAQEDVLNYFEDAKDVVVFHNFEEAIDKAKYYLKNESERARIVEKAQIKIESEHRTHHRLEKIKQLMSKRFGL